MNICCVLWLLSGRIRLVYMLWKRQKCFQRPGRRYSRKSPALMTPYVSTKTGILVSVFFLSVLLPQSLFTLLYPSLRRPRSFPSQSPLWSLSLIVLRGVEVMRVYCWHWIAETESEMTKPPFFLVCSFLLQYLPLQRSLNIIILWKKKGKRKQMKLGYCMWSENNIEEKKIVKMKWLGEKKNNHITVCSPVCVLNMCDVM